MVSGRMTSTLTSKDRFLAACRGDEVDGPPAWVMRQAGRYLPEYRAMREGKSFLDMVHAPEVAAELTCQPLRRFDMDAAVIFCDILVPPAAMGLEVEFVGGVGPVMRPPVRSRDDVEALQDFDATEKTPFLAEAIRRVRGEIGDGKAIIGFCGAPWTVASYMVEGGSSRNYENAKKMMFGEPETFARLCERIVDNQIGYLKMQVEAGANVLQVFDSWGGAIDAPTYEKVLLPHVARLIGEAKSFGVPVILYANGGNHLLEVLASAQPNVMGIDWRISLSDARRRLGPNIALQGNMDPCILFAPPEVVEREANRVLDEFGKEKGYIFNLGSGILPKTPVESMEAIFRAVKARREA